MGRFADIAAGKKARLEGVAFTSLHGVECVVDLGLITGDDDVDCIEAAGKLAKEKGFEAKRGDPMFDFASNTEIVFRAALDPSSPRDKPVRFFASVAELRQNLDRDRIQYLAARQAAFQEKTSPLKHELSSLEFQQSVWTMAATKEGDDDPFAHWAPSLLFTWRRITAFQLVSAHLPKSLSGIPSSGSPSEKTAQAPSDTSASPSPASDVEPAEGA